MKLPEYITAAEVRRVCKALGLRDWSRLKKPSVSLREARIILRALDDSGLRIEPEQFRAGLEVELEHGTMYSGANVTNNHPLLTGMIVLAHFHESPDYYRRLEVSELEVSELEGDLLKAIAGKKADKAKDYYRRIVRARARLAEAESRAVALTSRAKAVR